MTQLIIIGGGGHGRVVADVAKSCGYTDICFLDDKGIGTLGEYSIIGTTSDVDKYIGQAQFFVAIGNAKIREHLILKLKEKKASIATLIHKNAVIGSNVRIGEGSVVVAGAVINCDTTIGIGVIVNTCSSLDHDCYVGDFSHVSVAAHLCGTVKIGEKVWVGAGATVINNIRICDDCMIGAGAVVVKDIQASGTYIGIPAKVMA